MYAIIQTPGRQFRVSAGDFIDVDKMEAEVGSEIELNKILLVSGDSVAVGAPYVDGANVKAKVVGHKKLDKVISFMYKRRQRVRVKRGFRAQATTLQIIEINS